MFRIVLTVSLAAIVIGLAGCGFEPAPIETPPKPSDDPARAFPEFDLAYRGAGTLASEESPNRGRLGVRYFRFFEDGTVRTVNASTGRDRKVTLRMSAEAFSDLSSSEPTGVLAGVYEIQGDTITIRVGRDNVTNGRAWRSESLYRGEIAGDQLRLKRFAPKTDERMSPEMIYWPASQ